MEYTPPKAAVTPEMWEQGIRLADIMMPYAMKQTRDLFQREPGQTHGRLVHYTNADAALKIIKTRRFWMRNTNCMSDYSEVQHGVNIFNAFFSDPRRKESFIEALDNCMPGVASEAITAFNNSWSDIRWNSYIASLSEHQDNEDLHGRLSMWRAFGGTTTRIAIVLSVPYPSLSTLALRLMFMPVRYLPEAEAHTVLEEFVRNVRANRDYLCTVGREALVRLVVMAFLSGVLCLKHECFHEEREWRAIYAPTLECYAPTLGPSPLMESSTEVIAGVPQTIYKVPLDASVSDEIADLDFTKLFDRLIIGPTEYPLPISGAFVEELRKVGVADSVERVHVSGIPIRG